MPTRPTKGDHGHSDRGSRARGGQKATYGSAISADVAKQRKQAERGAAADTRETNRE